jgi:aminopeptidase N
MTRRSTRAMTCLAAACAILCATAVQAQPRFSFDDTPGVLPKTVVPSRYAITLDLDPARDDFSGQVQINVKVRKAAPFIELHANELKATRATLISGGVARPLHVVAQDESQTWRLMPADNAPIAAGEHRIELAYSGQVHPYGEGLFRATYEREGKTEPMLATQLEAISARMVFPSFDEPVFRAAFQLTVRAPSQYEVLSNMPAEKHKPDGAVTVHSFPATPAMPSYLFSVAVGHVESISGRAAGIPLRIITAPGKREHAHYALKATQQLLPYYTQYFGVPFALPKLDQMAVPSTRWGAMEDWGLISYAENDLLVDEKKSSARTRRDVFQTVAHEVAHQWFGNLVTAASWEEIWLNEAFATWLQNKASDKFNPAWKVPLDERVPIDRAMLIDAGGATRAIRSGPVRESAVNDVFDPITYAKGGAVLTMLEHWIGPKAFQQGLASYMKSQRFSNATAGDLWYHIGRASGRDVNAVAATWTDQPGFPLVQVQESCRDGKASVTLTQSRYLNATGAAGSQVWKIPVTMARGQTVKTELMDRAQQTFTLGACGSQPLVVNAGGGGFYRVAYEPAALKSLTASYAALGDGDRMGLLSDTFALVQSGRVPLNDYFSLLAALSRVTDSSRTMLWNVARSQLEFLDTSMAGTPAQQQVRATGRSLLGPQLAKLGFTPAAKEEAATSELRAGLIQLLSQFDDEETVRKVLRAFDDDESGKAPLPTSLREAVIRATGVHADKARFDKLMARLKKASGEEERWLYAKALASGRDAKRAQELLAASTTDVAPPNVATALPGMVARNSPFGEMAYQYTLSNFKRLGELSGTWGRQFLLPKAAEGFNDAERAAKLIEDQRREVGKDGDTLAAREAEAIRLRAAVKAREATGLEKALPG